MKYTLEELSKELEIQRTECFNAKNLPDEFNEFLKLQPDMKPLWGESYWFSTIKECFKRFNLKMV